VGGFSPTTNNTSGPGGGGTKNERLDGFEQNNVVAALSQHTNTATPVATLTLPSGKSQLVNTSSSSSSSAKQFLTRRVRSRSKTDAQSVSDKSLFSRIFSKKSKKPMGTLITTKSIDLDINKKRTNPVNKTSLPANDPRSTIDEEEEYDYGDDDERNISTGSLSDTDHLDEEDNDVNTSRSSNTTRGGSRTNSGSGKNANAAPNVLSLPTSDSQYYASMSSAPTGFSISYHKRTAKNNDNLRIQAALGRLQQQNKKGAATTSSGASQLMVCQIFHSIDVLP
jgi:hypothetical protein